MSWFIFAIICILGWGCADLFYKKSSDSDDRYSHLKIAVWVGIIMGIVAFCLLPFSESQFDIASFFVGVVKYSPASLFYIISMVIGYAGLRYLEVSIVSPVQNASGALSMVFMIVYFTFVGRITSIFDEMSVLDLIGTIIIVIGMIALAIVEQVLSKEERKNANRKYVVGALALIFPILYCVFDTLGTAADGIILDEEVGLGLGEIDVIILYGFTFLVAGFVCWIFLRIRTKKFYNPFRKSESPKAIAAICEEFGQIFYVYALSGNPIVAAPMVASYCIVSVILARVILKEKLKISQYLCVFAVIAGIVILGISEGLAEA